jgi:hypothetical protein
MKSVRGRGHYRADEAGWHELKATHFSTRLAAQGCATILVEIGRWAVLFVSCGGFSELYIAILRSTTPPSARSHRCLKAALAPR